MWKATYTIVLPYLLIHSVATVCCYKGWLPQSFKIPNKDVFDFQIVLNFVVINSIPPLIKIRQTVLGAFPILMISTYL